MIALFVFVVVASSLLATGCSSRSNSPSATSSAAPQATARALADHVAADIAARRFSQVEAAEAPWAKDALAADKIRAVWQSVLDENGAYVRRGTPVTATVLENDLFDYPLMFEHGKAHLQVTVNGKDEVTGLVLRPGDPTGKFGK
jgi:hypothetical protein